MELRSETGLADGNLHVQTTRLVEAGYHELRKLPHGRRTRTAFRVTEWGSTRLRFHVQLLQGVLKDSEGTIRPRLARDREDDAKVW
jgi:DNA-binding PadR family transcriptional regulator